MRMKGLFTLEAWRGFFSAQNKGKAAENAPGRYIDNKRPPSYLSGGLASTAL
jgi:hypothetical protein